MFYFVILLNTVIGLLPMIIWNHFIIIQNESSIIRDLEIRERDEKQLSINEDLPDSFYEKVKEILNKRDLLFEEFVINDPETSEEETNLLLNSKRKKK